MRVYMREFKQAYNSDLIIISSKYLYKMDRICENLETIDKRSDYQKDYYDALVVHACSVYVLFYKKRIRDGYDYINKKERYYKIRKFSYATNNNTWNFYSIRYPQFTNCIYNGIKYPQFKKSN